MGIAKPIRQMMDRGQLQLIDRQINVMISLQYNYKMFQSAQARKDKTGTQNEHKMNYAFNQAKVTPNARNKASAKPRLQNNEQIQIKNLVERKQTDEEMKGNQKVAAFKYLFLGTLLLELITQSLCLFLLQASSKISFAVLCALIIGTIILPVIVLLAFCRVIKNDIGDNLQITPCEIHETAMPSCPNQMSVPTLPRIRAQKLSSDNVKTKKLKPTFLADKNGSLKIETIQKMNWQSEQKEDNIQTDEHKVGESLKIFAGVKAAHNIFEFVVHVTINASVLNPVQVGLTVEVILIFAGYLLIAISSFLTMQLYFQLLPVFPESKQPRGKGTKQDISRILECNESSKAPTVMSIDRHLKEFQDKDEGSISIKIVKVQKSYGSIHPVTNKQEELQSSEESSSHQAILREEQIVVPQVERKDQQNKLSIKKSVLKLSKSNRPRGATIERSQSKNQSEETVEKRKVEINSLKIEYFQYQRMSAHSVAGDEEVIQNSSNSNKRCKNRPKSKYFKPKIEVEFKELETKEVQDKTKKRSQSEHKKASANLHSPSQTVPTCLQENFS